MQDQLRRQIAEALQRPAGERGARLRWLLRSPLVRWSSHASTAASQPPQQSDSDTWLEVIFDHVKEAIITVDDSGRILTSNPAAERIFGFMESTLAGESIDSLVPSITPPASVLQRLSIKGEDTLTDLAPKQVEALRADGDPITVELAASRAQRGGKCAYVLCFRDITERRLNEKALRESEERYRTLVENAPEAIVVLDLDNGRFVEANENAVKLFGFSKQQLFEVGPEAISPEHQPDGLPSFGLERGYIDRALKGGRPVFEWLHQDMHGRAIPCEVRFIRLPGSASRLIRASIIDIAARKRSELLAYGERRVLELIAGNAPFAKVLNAVVRVVEQIYPDTRCAVMLLDPSMQRIALGASINLPQEFRDAIHSMPVGLRSGASGAAASLGRQIIVRDIARDALWSDLRGVAEVAGVRACCSTPIVTTGERVHGTFDIYFSQARNPRTEELDLVSRLTQLAGIAVKRRQDEAALLQSEQRYRGLFQNVVDGVYQVTPAGDVLSANPALVRILGYDSEAELKAVGRTSQHFTNPAARDRLVALLESKDQLRDYEYDMCRKDGSIITVVENSRVVRNDDGALLYYEGTITDITQRKAAERALFEEKERAQVTLESIGDAVITTDSLGHIEYLNPVAEELTGWDNRRAIGHPIDEVVRLVDERNKEAVENPVLRCLAEGRVTGLADDTVLINRSDDEVAIQDSAAPIHDRMGNVVGAVMVFHDVSRERRIHRKLSYYASHDSLTGLINRREFEDRLSAAVKASQREEIRASALLYMDLDQFKVVNDTCGHSAGDQLLRQLANVLQSRIRTDDVLARLGGDEFAVLLLDCSVSEAAKVADDLREAVADYRFKWRNGGMTVGVSIGIVPIDRDVETIAGLFSAADVACYVAKDLGRNRIHIYQEGDAAERHKEMQWVARITSAMEDSRLKLFYQPIVPIGNTDPTGVQYELLLRMKDESGELIAPSAFIPAAERYNLMPGMDRWVVHQALSQLVCQSEGRARYTLAVNLSGTSLNDPRFLDFLIAELSTHEPPDGSICFEITETAAINDLDHVVNFMGTVKRLGCQFSLDDFGSGVSSLTYLKHLPVDFLKIDGQFVKNIAHDPVNVAMVEAVHKMAGALGIQTIAERVESRDVLEKLAEIGVGYAQGFYIAVPRSVEELERQDHRWKLPAIA